MTVTKAIKVVKPETITVEVTDKYIQRGIPKDGENCAIALALRGMRYRDVQVGGGFVSMSRGKKRFSSRVPKLAQRFISNFDSKKPVKPFSFRLKLSEESNIG